MPLPTDALMAWPPEDACQANRYYEKWSAWWSGDVDALARVYANAIGYDGSPVIPGDQPRQPIATAAPRFFHGTPAAAGQLRGPKLHVPLAADIATTSANLLFAEPPVFVITGDDAGKRADDGAGPASVPAAQKRLDELFEQGGFYPVLLEGAEICSALSGVYLRLGWDKAIADHVLLDAIPPDAAVPEWRSGRLSAVTFWRVLPEHDSDGHVWRHLERHERGTIFHGLFAGSDGMLGERRDLADHPDTATFAAIAAKTTGEVKTGADALACEYIPNMRPQRGPLRGTPIGRSDLDGIEHPLDALDEAWTSWMRDLRLGKGRLIVPELYLQDQGRGKGALFDGEQEIYQTVDHMPGSEQLAIQLVQFEIRVQQHEQTCADLTAQCLRGAGYSTQTFGEADQVAATATEVVARERLSYTTRGRKIEYWRPALRRLAYTALQIDRQQFGTKVEPAYPDVEFPDGVAVDPEAHARTIQILDAARAVSTRTKVVMLHPEWDDKQIDDEVSAIDAAQPNADVGFPGTTVTGTPADAAAADAGATPDKTGASTASSPARAGTPAKRKTSAASTTARIASASRRPASP